MDDFLSFRKMITPVLIQIMFWVGTAISVLLGLAAMARGEVGVAFLFIIVGPFLIRIYCELMILFFRMNATLTDMSKASGGTFSSPSSTYPPHAQTTRPAPNTPGALSDSMGINYTPAKPVVQQER